MMRHSLASLVLLPTLAAAQGAAPPITGPNGPSKSGPPASTAPAMPGPPIRKIETATHVSTELLGAITGVRQLSDGRVLVNDGTRRRLLMFDSTMQHVSVVLDSVADVENAYGTTPGAIIPYLGDSTLFIDRGSYSMLVLDGNGKIVRVRAVPTTAYLPGLTTVPGVDPSGQLVMRIAAKTAPPPPNLPANANYFPQPPDSAFIVRLNLNTRKLDTAGVIRIPKSTVLITQTPDGGMSARSMINPFPTTDDWAVLSDGTIAFVRGRDYRVEWEGIEKTVTSSPKLPFDWVRLSDDDKVRMADSVKKVQADLQANRYFLNMMSWVNAYGQQYPKDFQIPSTLVFPAGMPSNWILPPGYSLPAGYERGPPQLSPFLTPQPPLGATPAVVSSAGGAPSAAGPAATKPAGAAAASGVASPTAAPTAMQAAAPAAKSAAPPVTTIPPMPTPTTTVAIAVASVLPAEEWPDYKPPFATGAARADWDDNLWVRINLMHPIPGGTIYDVINKKGELFDRIQLPVGHTLVGFGSGRVVYLSIRDATGLHLERVRLKP